jgi:hypothetical protein
MAMNRTRLLLLGAMAAFIGAFFAFDLSRFFTLDALKAQQAGGEAALSLTGSTVASYFGDFRFLPCSDGERRFRP